MSDEVKLEPKAQDLLDVITTAIHDTQDSWSMNELSGYKNQWYVWNVSMAVGQWYQKQRQGRK